MEKNIEKGNVSIGNEFLSNLGVVRGMEGGRWRLEMGLGNSKRFDMIR